MRRRDFLKTAGSFVASAAVPIWVGACGDDTTEPGAETGARGYTFPQGVASGDPQPSAVMLWTRVVAKDDDVDSIALTLEVSKNDKFSELVIKKTLKATAASDFTVRVLTEDLEPGQTYFYRFKAGAVESRVGRTRTAPERNADVDVRFAWVACQDYVANFYGSYRQLLNDDAAREADEQIQFVMHVGDFIYETRDEGVMQARNDDLEPVALASVSGKPRAVPAFPSGGGMTSSGANYANSVDDYRHIYKTYLQDPDLQDARARWPFICVWDDHEFSNDCWQTQVNYTDEASSDEPSQKRRVAASQAWFEYVPSVLSGSSDGDLPSDAEDFAKVSVEDAPYSDVVVVDEENNRKAIGAITIYRSLRWGKHLDLVLTDSRSYRSDHALAEELSVDDLLVFEPRTALPLDTVNTLDAGKTANDGKPPDMAGRFPNSRKDSPPGTMLGDAQKQWWKDVIGGSDATFKVWGNPVPLLRLRLDGSHVDLISDQLLLSQDAWDGYNTERKELMAFIKEQEVTNVISLSGDHHAHYAGLVYDDYDAPDPSPVMVDLAVAGISSSSQWQAVAGAFDANVPAALQAVAGGVKRVLVYDATALGGSDKAVVNLNTLILYGSAAANEAATSNDLDKIEAARDATVNPHLRYADSRANGYGLAHVSADRIDASLITIERSFEDFGKDSPGIHGEAAFVVQRVDKLADVELPEPTLTGKKPFPLR